MDEAQGSQGQHCAPGDNPWLEGVMDSRGCISARITLKKNDDDYDDGDDNNNNNKRDGATLPIHATTVPLVFLGR